MKSHKRTKQKLMDKPLVKVLQVSFALAGGVVRLIKDTGNES